MIASQARMKSKLIEKGATLPSAPMRRKQVSGSTEVQELPRLRDYAPGTDRVVFWQRSNGTCLGAAGTQIATCVQSYGRID